jgi:hypothetical protein
MYDLSLVTDTLKGLLTTAIAGSPIWGGGGPPTVSISGINPDLVTSAADCDLNLFLYHINEDKYLKNSFWTQAAQSGGSPVHQPVAFEPMALDLWYLLSARSSVSYELEQQVMSIALRCFHENAIVTLPTPGPAGAPDTELTISMNNPTGDELSRLWQAIAAPLRMTAEYRVAVAFLTPERLPAAPPHPTTWSLSSDQIPSNPPLSVPGATAPQPVTTWRRVTYVAPPSPGMPPTRSFDLVPASAAPAPPGAGQTVTVRGTGLADADAVYLVSIDSVGTLTEVDVTSWTVPLVTPYPSTPSGGVPVRVRPPATAGAAPANCPPPGHYYLRFGTPADPSWRSALVAFDLAAWLDPTGGPVLSPSGGVYTCTAVGVPASGAEVRLATVALLQTVSAVPGPGEWHLSGTVLTFAAPTGMPTGTYAVRVRGGDVESDPALWAAVP